MTKIERVTFWVCIHKDTGLWVAQCNELSGLVVHAYSGEELEEKLPAALRSFLMYTRNDDSVWHVKKEAAPGFIPPAYIAQRALSDPG